MSDIKNNKRGKTNNANKEHFCQQQTQSVIHFNPHLAQYLLLMWRKVRFQPSEPGSELKQFTLLRWEKGKEGGRKRSQEDEKSPLNNLSPCAHYLHGQKQSLSLHRFYQSVFCSPKILFRANLIRVMWAFNSKSQTNRPLSLLASNNTHGKHEFCFFFPREVLVSSPPQAGVHSKHGTFKSRSGERYRTSVPIMRLTCPCRLAHSLSPDYTYE